MENEIIIKDSKDIAEYDITLEAIKVLKERYSEIAPSDAKTLKTAKAARKDVKDRRIAVEARREELKKPILQAGRALDAKAKHITELLEAIEKPIDKKIKDFEAAEKKRKAEEAAKETKRVADIQKRIDAFYGHAKGLYTKTAADLKASLEFFKDCIKDDSFDYAEFSIKAQAAKDEVLAELQAAYTAKQAQEEEAKRLAAEKAEIEKQRAELAKKEAALAAQKEEVKPVTSPANEGSKPKLMVEATPVPPKVHVVKDARTVAVTGYSPRDENFANFTKEPPKHPPHVYGCVVKKAFDNNASPEIGKVEVAHDFSSSVDVSFVEYNELKEKAEKFDLLLAHGVDNWVGYGDAMAEYEALENEE